VAQRLPNNHGALAHKGHHIDHAGHDVAHADPGQALEASALLGILGGLALGVASKAQQVHVALGQAQDLHLRHFGFGLGAQHHQERKPGPIDVAHGCEIQANQTHLRPGRAHARQHRLPEMGHCGAVQVARKGEGQDAVGVADTQALRKDIVFGGLPHYANWLAQMGGKGKGSAALQAKFACQHCGRAYALTRLFHIS
jgi:hypothetical protein